MTDSHADAFEEQFATSAWAATSPAPPPGGRLFTDQESLLGFKKAVLRHRDTLHDSDAGPRGADDDRIPAEAVGTGFAEATELHLAYAEFHADLTDGCALLIGQMDSLNTAVDGAHSGYADVDFATRQAMWAVRAKASQHYDARADPYGALSHRTGDA
jgi:hypothetical protein